MLKKQINKQSFIIKKYIRHEPILLTYRGHRLYLKVKTNVNSRLLVLVILNEAILSQRKLYDSLARKKKSKYFGSPDLAQELRDLVHLQKSNSCSTLRTMNLNLHQHIK